MQIKLQQSYASLKRYSIIIILLSIPVSAIKIQSLNRILKNDQNGLRMTKKHFLESNTNLSEIFHHANMFKVIEKTVQV